MSESLHIHRDKVIDSLLDLKRLKIPRYRGFGNPPALGEVGDEPGMEGNIILDRNTGLFCYHDGITWQCLGPGVTSGDVEWGQNIGCAIGSPPILLGPDPDPSSAPPDTAFNIGLTDVGQVYVNKVGNTLQFRRLASPLGTIEINTTSNFDSNPNCVTLDLGAGSLVNVGQVNDFTQALVPGDIAPGIVANNDGLVTSSPPEIKRTIGALDDNLTATAGVYRECEDCYVNDPYTVSQLAAANQQDTITVGSRLFDTLTIYVSNKDGQIENLGLSQDNSVPTLERALQVARMRGAHLETRIYFDADSFSFGTDDVLRLQVASRGIASQRIVLQGYVAQTSETGVVTGSIASDIDQLSHITVATGDLNQGNIGESFVFSNAGAEPYAVMLGINNITTTTDDDGKFNFTNTSFLTSHPNYIRSTRQTIFNINRRLTIEGDNNEIIFEGIHFRIVNNEPSGDNDPYEPSIVTFNKCNVTFSNCLMEQDSTTWPAEVIFKDCIVDTPPEFLTNFGGAPTSARPFPPYTNDYTGTIAVTSGGYTSSAGLHIRSVQVDPNTEPIRVTFRNTSANIRYSGVSANGDRDITAQFLCTGGSDVRYLASTSINSYGPTFVSDSGSMSIRNLGCYSHAEVVQVKDQSLGNFTGAQGNVIPSFLNTSNTRVLIQNMYVDNNPLVGSGYDILGKNAPFVNAIGANVEILDFQIIGGESITTNSPASGVGSAALGFQFCNVIITGGFLTDLDTPHISNMAHAPNGAGITADYCNMVVNGVRMREMWTNFYSLQHGDYALNYLNDGSGVPQLLDHGQSTSTNNNLAGMYFNYAKFTIIARGNGDPGGNFMSSVDISLLSPISPMFAILHSTGDIQRSGTGVVSISSSATLGSATRAFIIDDSHVTLGPILLSQNYATFIESARSFLKWGGTSDTARAEVITDGNNAPSNVLICKNCQLELEHIEMVATGAGTLLATGNILDFSHCRGILTDIQLGGDVGSGGCGSNGIMIDNSILDMTDIRVGGVGGTGPGNDGLRITNNSNVTLRGSGNPITTQLNDCGGSGIILSNVSQLYVDGVNINDFGSDGIDINTSSKAYIVDVGIARNLPATGTGITIVENSSAGLVGPVNIANVVNGIFIRYNSSMETRGSITDGGGISNFGIYLQANCSASIQSPNVQCTIAGTAGETRIGNAGAVTYASIVGGSVNDYVLGASASENCAIVDGS